MWTLGIISICESLIDNATEARKISHSVCQCLSIRFIFVVSILHVICYDDDIIQSIGRLQNIGFDAFMRNEGKNGKNTHNAVKYEVYTYINTICMNYSL